MVLKWKRWVCLHAHMSNPQHMGIIIILKYHIYAYGSPSHIFFVFCYIDIYCDIIFDIIRLHGVQKKMEHLQFHVLVMLNILSTCQCHVLWYTHNFLNQNQCRAQIWVFGAITFKLLKCDRSTLILILIF